MKVAAIMHRGIHTVEGGAPIADVARLMRDRDIGAVPVLENGTIVGIVTDRDLAVRAIADGRDPAGLKARDVMTRDVVSARANEEAEDALRLMETKAIRRLPVLADDGKLVGMLALGDISHALPSALTAEVVEAVSAHHA